MTEREAKITAATNCITEHRSHVAPHGAQTYGTNEEADAAAMKVLQENLDTAQIEAAFERAKQS